MAKSRAEVQKAYRERRKAREGSTYLRQETERVKKYYKPTTAICTRKLAARRQRIRECMRRNRRERRQPRVDQIEEQDQIPMPEDSTEHLQGPCDSTTDNVDVNKARASTSTIRAENFVVKMRFEENRGRWKKSDHLKKTELKINALETKVSSLKKRNESLRKKLQRCQSGGVTSPNEIENTETTEKTPKQTSSRKRKYKDISTLTPNSKSKEEIRNEGLSPSKYIRLVKKLTFHNTLIEDMREHIKHDRGRSRQRSALQIICGKVMKKYRMKSRCSEELGVNRKQVSMSERRKAIQKGRKVLERKQTAASVVKFLEREDNSACLPGKRDTAKTKDGVTQSRVLNDYLYNLHLKYISENGNTKISLTTFASYRPGYIKLVQYSSRRTCLCQRHQNIALKVKGIKSIGATSTDNPDTLVRQSSDEEILQRINECEADTIKFAQWKRKEVVHKGKMTKRMMLENVQMSKLEFIDMFRNDLVEFRQHTERVKCQYEQVKLLKERLPQNHYICQMDFAENYSCGHAEEIQTAYFDKCSVTLHPVVIYTKDSEGTMVHASYIYVSDTMSHNSGTVYAFLKRITDELKSRNPNIEYIHYITDSPTSQYRNKAMMYVVANHDTMFGFKASWQYWEAGHGKGPCDGVGGTSKRLADLAVKRQTHIIQSANDYYHWGISQSGSQTKYRFVPKEECDDAHLELSSLNIKPIKGTLEIHSVVSVDHGVIAVRNTSCFCERCFENGEFKVSCKGWTTHTIINKNDNEPRGNIDLEKSDADIVSEVTSQESVPVPGVTSQESVPVPVVTSQESVPVRSDASTMGDKTSALSENVVPVNNYVAAVYNGYWYLGKVVSYDPNDENLPYQISFMQHGKGKVCHTFKWPDKEDVIWRERADILCVVHEPVRHGTRKMFKLQESDIHLISESFDKYK